MLLLTMLPCYHFSPNISEINEREKEKLIFQMAYRCDPPELPDIEELLKQRRPKKIDIDICPRSRQSECE